MVQYVLKRTFYAGHIAFDLPQDAGAREAIRRELERCRDKNNDFVLITMQPPKRPRTTGEGSQNHHLNGHILQICNETGNDYDTVKDAVKQLAVEQMGYPYKTIGGRIVPQRERECSTDECAKLIEAAHILAADLGIILQE
jgi:hypothetical protein